MSAKDLFDAPASVELTSSGPGAACLEIERSTEAWKSARAIERVAVVGKDPHLGIEASEEARDPGNADAFGLPTFEQRDGRLRESTAASQRSLTQPALSTQFAQHTAEHLERFDRWLVETPDPMGHAHDGTAPRLPGAYRLAGASMAPKGTSGAPSRPLRDASGASATPPAPPPGPHGTSVARPRRLSD